MRTCSRPTPLDLMAYTAFSRQSMHSVSSGSISWVSFVERDRRLNDLAELLSIFPNFDLANQFEVPAAESCLELVISQSSLE